MSDEEISESLTEIGETIIQKVSNDQVPSVQIPSRTTSNIVYDENAKCYVLGDKRTNRDAGNIRHVKRLAQMLKVASFCKNELMGSERHVTKRELYYISESWGDKLKFKTQDRSDDLVEDIEAMIGRPREDLKINPKAKGSIYGDITLKFTNPRGETMEVNCLDSADGQSIGPRTCEADIVECNADKVIAIETDGMYNRLMEENAHEKFNAVLVNLGGQATRATRRIIKRINELKDIPAYIFTDSDPWGLHIAMVIIAGSAKSAHINERLATPDAKWLGVTASDIKNYKLRSDELRDVDFKRVDELKDDPRYANDKRLVNELNRWEEIGKKSEQQALMRYGFEYVVDEYLPAKLEELGAPGFK
ncbi:MAG: DNA topoisomerase VI [Candidatus Aenigmatarchaeota archaeon]